jgi:DNA polymerase
MDTWGGRLVENIVQATANDVLRYATINLEAAGYPLVLHVYDEIVSEIPQGWGDLLEFERIMGTMPPWAHGWPIKAAGGWRGRRYRKG